MAEKLHNRVEIPETECLFTGKKYKTFEENLDHMFRDHGFYIPEQKYLVDKSGLFKYFSEKIGLGNMCFCCSYQGRSLEAVRAHMLSKSIAVFHTKRKLKSWKYQSFMIFRVPMKS